VRFPVALPDCIIRSMQNYQRPGQEPNARIILAALGAGAFGITMSFGQSLADAASVCLEGQGHESGVIMPVDGSCRADCSVYWDPTSEKCRRTWADLHEATEHGAYGVAFLLVRQLKNMTIGERSYRGTGFDFWVGNEDSYDILFQKKARLEVSGIRTGSETLREARVREKIEQVSRVSSSFPAIVVVVEFGRPQSTLVEV
jgi:hypothetical protein